LDGGGYYVIFFIVIVFAAFGRADAVNADRDWAFGVFGGEEEVYFGYDLLAVFEDSADFEAAEALSMEFDPVEHFGEGLAFFDGVEVGFDHMVWFEGVFIEAFAGYFEAAGDRKGIFIELFFIRGDADQLGVFGAGLAGNARNRDQRDKIHEGLDVIAFELVWVVIYDDGWAVGVGCVGIGCG